MRGYAALSLVLLLVSTGMDPNEATDLVVDADNEQEINSELEKDAA